jgi:nickel/cobalt transporter (NicO) family protein
MNAPLVSTLAIAAATVGTLHSLAPDHWLPVAAVARARGWSHQRTARVALLCGFGHVTVSAALGLVALASGTAVIEALGARSSAVAGVLLIGFGVAYALWGARHAIARRLHGHDHHHYDHVHDPASASAWSLFAIYCADPCVAVVPIVFAAAPLSAAATIGIVVVYEIATIATMVGLTVAARVGTGLIRGQWVERYGDSAAGALIVVTGIVVAVLGL